MSEAEPTTTIDERYSTPGTPPTPWSSGRATLADDEVFWVVTMRPDGRPHATPLLAVWLDGAVVFTTGEGERKARNLEQQTACLLLSSDRSRRDGLAVAVEGHAVPIHDEDELARVADAYVAKYGEDWRYHVVDGDLAHEPESLRGEHPGRVLAFRLAPVDAFGFGTGDPYSQTRWSFGPPSTGTTS
jgi:Pyridoxamine 5'-phosphate oxidase